MTAAPRAAVPRNRRRRAADQALGRLLRGRGDAAGPVEYDVRIPMRDGVDLLADHYVSRRASAGTVLIRSPYGANAVVASVFAGPYVSDGFVRLDPERADGVLRLELDAVAHRGAVGSRIQLLIAGGSLPRWERNLGTGEDPATSTSLAPSHRTIDPAGSRLLLPVRA